MEENVVDVELPILLKDMEVLDGINLDPDSETGKGFIAEMIVVKTRGIKNCNLELDNFNSPFDIMILNITKFRQKGLLLMNLVDGM